MKRLCTLHVIILLAGLFSGHRLPAQTPLPCGVTDDTPPDSLIQLMRQLPRLQANQRARQAAGERNTCRVAVEIDSDTYLSFDKDTNRIFSYVLNRIEQVSKVYEREINTQLVVVAIHIWKDTEPDPYRGELNAFTLYNKFSSVWSSQFKGLVYDKRIYLYTKPVTAAGGIGGGNQALSHMDPLVIAHEIGHCFDSPHTHSCSWPGGPIDYCSPTEGACYSASLQYGPGSIMSYCMGQRQLTFHPLCQALMQSHAQRNLPVLAKPDKAPVLPAQLVLSETPFLYWNGQPQAGRYDIDIASDVNFTQNLRSDTSAVNGYDMSQAAVNQLYYVRVRAVNTAGRSDWSAVCQFKRIPDTKSVGPVLLFPAADQRLVSPTTGARTFTVQPVAGASAYELWVTYATDEFFQYPTLKLTAPGPVIATTLYSTGTLLWRVRAIVGGQTGPWSATGRFGSTYNRSANLPVTNRNQTPRTVPFSVYASSTTSTIRVALATDTLFTRPVRTYTFQNGGFYAGMLSDLLPNTQYYLLTEETNTNDATQLPGVLSRSIDAFRTGSVTVPSNWSFINNVTHPTLPQAPVYGPLIPTDEAAWIVTDRGLTRIDPDSLTLRFYDRNATNGKLGNISAAISPDAANSLWVMNRISQGDFATTYLQTGRYDTRTGDLTDRTTFYAGDRYLPLFTGASRLFYAYGGPVYEQKGNDLAVFYQPADGWYTVQTFIRPGVMWFMQQNTANSSLPNQLVRLNTLTKEIQTFSATNTPQLTSRIAYATIDGLGNFWVSQYNPTGTTTLPLARFDGTTWTNLPRSSVPFTFTSGLCSDPQGNVYAISSDANPANVIYKYNGVAWKKVADMPFAYVGSPTADNRGNLWFSGQYQLLRYATCSGLPATAITTTRPTLEIGENTTLQAAGCQNVAWSWQSSAETVSSRIILGTNQLVVAPAVNTTYQGRCYDDGCSGPAATLSVVVLPKLTLGKPARASICAGDSLTVGYGLLGSVAAGNQFALVAKQGTQTTTLPAMALPNGTLAVRFPTTLPAGPYVVYAQTTQPLIRSRDSVLVTVAGLPTAELSTMKPMFSLGDSTRIVVTLTGTAPWQFTRWDGRRIATTSSSYTAFTTALQPASYSLTVTALRDANCSTGIVVNNLTVSALPLGVEPATPGAIIVYPNPTTGRLTVEGNPAVLVVSMKLTDGLGRTVLYRRRVVPLSRDEWDISALPAATYLLTLETSDGKQVGFKVVKH